MFIGVNNKTKIISTCVIKFPIYPINWSGYRENEIDYLNFREVGLEIDFNRKFNKCLESLKRELEKTNLDDNLINFIKNNFNKKLLFTHSLHPTNVLLYELYRSIFNTLDINIDNYEYTFNNELILCWYNPFTTKMITDLNIEFTTIVDDEFYINRFNENNKFYD